ncbi:MAG: type II toxin-antitoxin system HicB family antitoxin [ANME-2 cluster archaeon]|nr:type II toxin-antitoxin system HicB family antitoxin [ANME-2 cluster archaeon]
MKEDNDAYIKMSEYMIFIMIEKLEEGGYLATSDSIKGLIAQGRTIAETMEIAQDVAKKLIESYIEHNDPLPFEANKSINHIINVQIPVSIEA